MLMACLSSRPHITLNFNDSFNGANEGDLKKFEAFKNGHFTITSNEKAAMDCCFEGRFPSRVCLCSADDARISNASIRERLRCIGKLACSENRILEIVRNTELGKLVVRLDGKAQEATNLPTSSQPEKMRHLCLQV